MHRSHVHRCASKIVSRRNPWAQHVGCEDSIVSMYDKLVTKGAIVGSLVQRQTAGICCDIYRQFNEAKRSGARCARGIYLYGGVGVGKTMLMDLFELRTTPEKKRRVHLHSFMSQLQQEIHKVSLKQAAARRAAEAAPRPLWSYITDVVPFLASAQAAPSPMEVVVPSLVSEAPLLCFDEFQTFDIAHASLLAGFFRLAFQRSDMFLFATSNKAPEELLNINGALDELVPWLRHRCAVIEMPGDDYRTLAHRHKDTPGSLCCDDTIYRFPNSDANTAALMGIAQAGFQSPRPWESGGTGIYNFGRELLAPHFCGGVVVFQFLHLCSGHYGPSEFQSIATGFHTVILLDVPQISAVSKNAAKQFIILVDELYQHKVKLCMTTAVPWRKLLEPPPEDTDDRHYYSEVDDDEYFVTRHPHAESKEEVLSFARIHSRLSEMCTAEYLLDDHTEFIDMGYNRRPFLGVYRTLTG